MTILEFIQNNPITSVILAYLVCQSVVYMFQAMFCKNTCNCDKVNKDEEG